MTWRSFGFAAALLLTALPASGMDDAEARRRCTSATDQPGAREAACTHLVNSDRESDAGKAIALHNRAMVLSNQGNTDAAFADYDAAIRYNPKQAGSYYNRGRLWRQRNDRTRAIEDYSAAIRLKPDESSFFNSRGLAQEELNNLDAALADFETAIRLNARNPDPYFNRAIVRRKQGDHASAIGDLNTAILLERIPRR